MLRLLLITLASLALCGSASAATSSAGCAGAVSWQTAAHSSGTVTVRAHIDGAKFVHWKSGKGTMTFLDVGGAYPHSRFTIVVWNADASKYAGRTVCARGSVSIYKGKPELSVDSPAALTSA